MSPLKDRWRRWHRRDGLTLIDLLSLRADCLVQIELAASMGLQINIGPVYACLEEVNRVLALRGWSSSSEGDSNVRESGNCFVAELGEEEGSWGCCG